MFLFSSFLIVYNLYYAMICILKEDALIGNLFMLPCLYCIFEYTLTFYRLVGTSFEA